MMKDVEGPCALTAGKKGAPTLRFMQAQESISDGKTSRWRWKVMRTDLLVSFCTKDAGKPKTKGPRSGCHWRELWQAHGKLVNAKVNDLNAAKEMGMVPDMTSWAVSVLIEHRNDKNGIQPQQGGGCKIGQLDHCGLC